MNNEAKMLKIFNLCLFHFIIEINSKNPMHSINWKMFIIPDKDGLNIKLISNIDTYIDEKIIISNWALKTFLYLIICKNIKKVVTTKSITIDARPKDLRVKLDALKVPNSIKHIKKTINIFQIGILWVIISIPTVKDNTQSYLS